MRAILYTFGVLQWANFLPTCRRWGTVMAFTDFYLRSPFYVPCFRYTKQETGRNFVTLRHRDTFICLWRRAGVCEKATHLLVRRLLARRLTSPVARLYLCNPLCTKDEDCEPGMTRLPRRRLVAEAAMTQVKAPASRRVLIRPMAL
jgi:hypothetical protein